MLALQFSWEDATGQMQHLHWDMSSLVLETNYQRQAPKYPSVYLEEDLVVTSGCLV
jgi:hypothetical protein